MGLSYGAWYCSKHKFNFSNWYVDNCDKCRFSNMREYMKDKDDTGLCFAELDQHILSNKPRLMIYIAIHYHKNRNGSDNFNCALRNILHGECESRSEQNVRERSIGDAA